MESKLTSLYSQTNSTNSKATYFHCEIKEFMCNMD